MSDTPTQSSPAQASKRDYRKTLNLPNTAFAMRANLVQNEPASIKRWSAMGRRGLYQEVRAARAGAERFVFHDGPPYANGSLHLGHLLNRTLKDFVVRTRMMAGLDCPYIPGWDCHGLPIEHKVVSELHASGKLEKLAALSDDERRMAIRKACAAYAEKFIKLQMGQMQRLLTVADYEQPYRTMDREYEAAVLELFADLVEKGLVYRALKSVHWSIENQTALAEAELEYYDREDESVYVEFESADAAAVAQVFDLDPAALDRKPTFMIWTTTPWTLPANLAIAVKPDAAYALVDLGGSLTIVAADLVERIGQAGDCEAKIVARAPGQKLVGLQYAHPLIPDRSAFRARLNDRDSALGDWTPWRLVPAPHVTLEDGTGLVHTAPGHGREDELLGRANSLPIYCPVREDGTYDDSVPKSLRGLLVWDANPKIVKTLRDSGHLYHSEMITHSYPHDWRGKSPVIFRATEQWFIAVDKPFLSKGEPDDWPPASLRERALSAVVMDPDEPLFTEEQRAAAEAYWEGIEVQEGEEASIERTAEPRPLSDAEVREALSKVKPSFARIFNTTFIPAWGRNRMHGMLESRPDWCISRQRAWGLPIPAFQTADGRTLLTSASAQAVARIVKDEGSDAWFTLEPADLLAGYDPAIDPDAPADLDIAQLRKMHDIFDVWFESGSSWRAAMVERGQGFPCDLYLEGSDQHRGWFQVSLLTALAANGAPPFKTLLTHGFMVDKDGRAMSKSLGNTLEVEDLLRDFGADVCRWWVSSLSYESDIKADVEFFQAAGESYRKVRNTLRFMLGNLGDFTPSTVNDDQNCGRDARATSESAHCVALADFPPTSLDAWILSRLADVARDVRRAYEAYNFRAAHQALYNFCNEDLSAIYLAAVKDRLYCDAPDSPRRRRTQTALWDLTDGLCRLLAPLIPHTADEAWRALRNASADDAETTVHLESFPDPSTIGEVRVEDQAWAAAMQVRDAALAALERVREAGDLDNPLDAGVVLPDAAGVLARFDATDLADLLGVSRVRLDPAAREPIVEDLRAEPRCERSWKRDGTVRQRADGALLCDRCALALGCA